MSKNELILNIFSVLGNIILIALCFAAAIIKDWWLCILIPFVFHFRIVGSDIDECMCTLCRSREHKILPSKR